MAYLQQLAQGASQGVGSPPSLTPKNIGQPGVPEMRPDVEAPPYDPALDPAWHGILHPQDHALRNLLSELSPEHRQLILQRLGKIPKTAPPQGF